LECKIGGEIKGQFSEYSLRTTRSTAFVSYCDYVKEISVRRRLNKREETNKRTNAAYKIFVSSCDTDGRLTFRHRESCI